MLNTNTLFVSYCLVVTTNSKHNNFIHSVKDGYVLLQQYCRQNKRCENSQQREKRECGVAVRVQVVGEGTAS